MKILEMLAIFRSKIKPIQPLVFSWTSRFIFSTCISLNLLACNAIMQLVSTPTNQVVVTVMMANLDGELIERNGCIRVKTHGTNEGYALVWPPELKMTIEDDHIRVESGLVSGLYEERVFHLGDLVELAGGIVGQPGEQLVSTIPRGCPGPYWVVGSNLSLFLPPPESD